MNSQRLSFVKMIAQITWLSGTPCAARANLRVALLDVGFALLQQPLTEVAIDFIYPLLQFVWRNLAEGLGTDGPLNLVQKAAGEGVRAVLNEPDEPVAEHHYRIPSHRCCFHTQSFPGARGLGPAFQLHYDVSFQRVM